MFRFLMASALVCAFPVASARAQQDLTPLAAEVVFPATSPDEITRMPNGNVRYKGVIAGSDSELRPVSGRVCAFQNQDLRTGRTTYQVNFGQAEKDFTTRPSRYGYAAIRLVGQGVYCSTDQQGVPVCNDVYDITAWGERDLQGKIRALRKLSDAGCLGG